MNILEDLVKRDILSEGQISEVVRIANEKYDGDIDLALSSFGVDEKKVAQVKSEVFGIPEKDLPNNKSINSELTKYISEDSVNHYKVVPIGMQDGVLEVGIIDPSNIEAMDALQFISSKLNIPFRIFIITPTVFKNIVDQYKGLSGEVDTALSELDTEIKDANTEEVLSKKQDKDSKKQEEKIVEDAPIIKIVAVIIKHAVEGNASDIHIENTGEKVVVRFRLDGILHTSLTLPLNVYAGVVARIKILSKLRLDEKRKPQDGSFSTKIEGRKIDFRVSTFPTSNGEKVVMRILDSEKGVPKLDELGLSPRNMKMLKDAIAKPYGLILITGPTGSGKTTTLYSILNELDREKSNVVSLEDPVEYRIDGVSQSQVMPEIGYTFASGLRSILRQDPDIILVGEIRDKETAQLAIQAALTGHLVLSTLHTNSAIGVVPRLVDMGIDPYLIAPTLILSVAQRLARKICPGGEKQVPVDEGMKMMMEKQFADLPESIKKEIEIGGYVHEAVPTAECPSGIRGRLAVFEMFEVDKKMEDIILKNPIEPEIYKVARDSGMLTMYEDAIIKSAKGEIPFQETYNFSSNIS